MKKKNAVKKTTVGAIHDDVLAYTAGKDVVLDLALVEADCLGSAAHATMLSKMPVKPALFSKSDVKAIIEALVDIMKKSAAGTFAITLEDQDVHLAVERTGPPNSGIAAKKSTPVEAGTIRSRWIGVCSPGASCSTCWKRWCNSVRC